jgi:hypothetical protein
LANKLCPVDNEHPEFSGWLAVMGLAKRAQILARSARDRFTK